MVRLGELSPEEGRNHPDKNIITRAVGTLSLIHISTMIQALKTVVPVKDKKKAKSGRRILLNVDQLQAASWLEQFRRRKYKAKIRLLEALVERPELTDEYVSKELKIPGETLKSLAEQGIIRLEQFTVYRNPIGESDVLVQEKEAPGLTAEQKEVLDGILREWEAGGRPCLIQGITGSGKTQMCIRDRLLCFRPHSRAF